MKRYSNVYKQQSGNMGSFYELLPLMRREVVPGETIRSIQGTVKFSSAMLRRFVETPALIQTFLFYVPHRLVFDEWKDFLAGDNDAITLPTESGWDLLLEQNAANRNTLARRGYKLIYNEFFGQETQSFYDDIYDDVDTNSKYLKIWDQYASKQSFGQVNSDTFEAAVSGTDPNAIASIPLEEFARAMRDSRSKNRFSISGDKYVDLMRAMGVDLDWRVQNAPEFLGSMTKKIMPFTLDSSEAASLEDRNSRYRGVIDLQQSKRRAFAEHGCLWVLATMRPAAFNEVAVPDSSLKARNVFYLGDNATIFEGNNAEGSSKVARFEYLRSGRNVYGRSVGNDNTPWLTNTPTQNKHDVYPDPAQWLPQSDMGGQQVSVVADMRVNHLTPVPPNRV